MAVVCGAWHVPALRQKATVAADRALLKGLPKVKTDMTWVPWTHRRLARASGYGAGVDSPGWYAHLFAAPDRPVERWMTKVAGLLRAEDRSVSSAHVIEAVRLAETLAAMRGRPLAGLGETTDAVRAVMCEGSDVPLALVHDRLVVGGRAGRGAAGGAGGAPAAGPRPGAAAAAAEAGGAGAGTGARPAQGDRCRTQQAAAPAAVAGRGVGRAGDVARQYRNVPGELAAALGAGAVGAGRRGGGCGGTTVLAAATAKAEADATAAQGLAEVTALAEHCLLAELPDALPAVMRVLADRAALDADVGHLAQALPALVRSLRYGDVRGTDTGALAEVAAGLAERVFVGLPPACAALDADAAEEMRRHVDAAHTAVGLLGDGPAADHGDLRGRWHTVLRVLCARDTVPGVIRGRAVRLLLDDGELAQDEAARLMGLVLSPGTPPADAAAWIEGFAGGGRRHAAGARRAAAGAGRRLADRGADGGVHRRTAAAAAHLLGVRARGPQDAGGAGAAGARAAGERGGRGGGDTGLRAGARRRAGRCRAAGGAAAAGAGRGGGGGRRRAGRGDVTSVMHGACGEEDV
ncbi:hypothetical protein GCM10020295_31390 [Streptomyces cinereospinus]